MLKDRYWVEIFQTVYVIYIHTYIYIHSSFSVTAGKLAVCHCKNNKQTKQNKTAARPHHHRKTTKKPKQSSLYSVEPQCFLAFFSFSFKSVPCLLYLCALFASPYKDSHCVP